MPSQTQSGGRVIAMEYMSNTQNTANKEVSCLGCRHKDNTVAL